MGAGRFLREHKPGVAGHRRRAALRRAGLRAAQHRRGLRPRAVRPVAAGLAASRSGPRTPSAAPGSWSSARASSPASRPARSCTPRSASPTRRSRPGGSADIALHRLRRRLEVPLHRRLRGHAGGGDVRARGPALGLSGSTLSPPDGSGPWRRRAVMTRVATRAHCRQATASLARDMGTTDRPRGGRRAHRHLRLGRRRADRRPGGARPAAARGDPLRRRHRARPVRPAADRRGPPARPRRAWTTWSPTA